MAESPVLHITRVFAQEQQVLLLVVEAPASTERLGSALVVLRVD